jgi:hypothetical protein
MSNYSKAPSSQMKLLASSNNAIGTSAEDLDTYVDGSAYEYLLIVLSSAKLAAETGTDVTLTVREADSADGATGQAAVNDPAGSALSLALGGSAAAGRGAAMQVRLRGRKKYLSPALVATGAAVTCNVSIFGVGPRDTAEIAASWTDEAHASVAATTIQ